MTTAKRKTGKAWTGRQRQVHPETHDFLRLRRAGQAGKARVAKRLNDALTTVSTSQMRNTIKKRIGQGRAGGPYNVEVSPRLGAALRRQTKRK